MFLSNFLTDVFALVWFCVLYVLPFILCFFLLELYSHQMLDDLCEGFTCIALHAFSSADYAPPPLFVFAVRLEFYAWGDD